MHLVSVAQLRRIMIAVIEVLFLNHEPPSHKKKTQNLCFQKMIALRES